MLGIALLGAGGRNGLGLVAMSVGWISRPRFRDLRFRGFGRFCGLGGLRWLWWLSRRGRGRFRGLYAGCRSFGPCRFCRFQCFGWGFCGCLLLNGGCLSFRRGICNRFSFPRFGDCACLCLRCRNCLTFHYCRFRRKCGRSVIRAAGGEQQKRNPCCGDPSASFHHQRLLLCFLSIQ